MDFEHIAVKFVIVLLLLLLLLLFIGVSRTWLNIITNSENRHREKVGSFVIASRISLRQLVWRDDGVNGE